MRTTRVDKGSYQNYLKKADQSIQTAKEAESIFKDAERVYECVRNKIEY
jgi:HEPN domain-containing protein